MRTLLIFAATVCFAAEPLVMPLWPGKADHAETFIGPNDSERRIRNVTNPTITAHLATRPNGTAVLIAPGGGFRHLAIDKEGHDVAKWLNSLGISAFVLQYSAGSDPDRPTVVKQSLADARQAMSILRARAVEFRIEPTRLGIMGFSAGGYLAADLGLRYTAESRPAFVVPIYPAAPPDLNLPADAPPAFFAGAHDDPLTAGNMIPLYLAWAKAKRPAALHVFPTGGHGFGFRKTGVGADGWPDRFAEWLRLQKLLP